MLARHDEAVGLILSLHTLGKLIIPALHTLGKLRMPALTAEGKKTRVLTSTWVT